MPNQTLSRLLNDAIMSTALSNLDEAIQDLEMFLEEGADPSEVVTLKLSEKDISVTAFCSALQLNNYKLMAALVRKSKQQNILIKLDAPFTYSTNGKKVPIHKNVFQQSCINNDLEIVNLLIEYGLDTKQDMYKICNQGIEIDAKGGTIVACLSDLMSLTITGSTLTASHSIPAEEGNKKKADEIISGLKKWRTFSIVANPESEAPVLPEVVKIYSDGRYDVLTSLTKHKLLDPEITSLDMHPMHHALKTLSSYNSVDEFMDDVASTINAFSNTKINKEDVDTNPAEPGVFIIQMSLPNPSRDLIQKFEVFLDLREAAKLVEQYAAEVKSGSLIRVQSFKKMKERLDKAEATLSDVPSVRLKTLRDGFAEYPSSLNCLNAVHAETLNTITALNIASTGMIGTKPTERSLQLAKIAQTAFQSVVNSINFPAVAVIPAVTGLILSTYINNNEKNKAKGVVRATSDLDVNALAVDVAALIAADVSSSGCRDDGKLADQLKTLVSEQIKQLKKFPEGTFTSPEAVVGYLASTAIAHVQANAPKKRTSSDAEESLDSYQASEQGSETSASSTKHRRRGSGKCSVQ